MNPTPGPIPGEGDGYWVNVDTLNQIRKECRPFRNEVAVYTALNLIASDEHSRCFRASLCYVGSLAGISRASAVQALQELGRIGVVAVERPRSRELTKITLLGEVRL